MSFPIITEFYDSSRNRNIVKTNRASNANRAVENALKFIACNVYGASYAQVFDSETAEVHAEIILRKNGKIEITYLRNARDFETRIRADVWLANEI
jgi:hypothetical protein